ncbi:MAG: hypothetical protein HFE43_04850 [Oscillospiraceae bacterium]|nr:hypothetical protein [Oscillospiraceae bacterium]
MPRPSPIPGYEYRFLIETGSRQAVLRLKTKYPNTCVVILYHLEAAIRGVEIKQL